MSKHTITITWDAKRFEDEDDCLEAAAVEAAKQFGVDRWQVTPSWVDDQTREEIALEIYASGYVVDEG